MISDGQRKVIKYIENNLDIKFNGITKEEARIFITDNIESSKNISNLYRNTKRKQWDEINELEPEDYYSEDLYFDFPH